MAIQRAHVDGRRVIAVGTSVVRAPEAWGESGIPKGGRAALRPQLPAGSSSMAFSSPLASSSRMMSQPPTNFPWM